MSLVSAVFCSNKCSWGGRLSTVTTTAERERSIETTHCIHLRNTKQRNKSAPPFEQTARCAFSPFPAHGFGCLAGSASPGGGRNPPQIIQRHRPVLFARYAPFRGTRRPRGGGGSARCGGSAARRGGSDTPGAWDGERSRDRPWFCFARPRRGGTRCGDGSASTLGGSQTEERMNIVLISLISRRIRRVGQRTNIRKQPLPRIRPKCWSVKKGAVWMPPPHLAARYPTQAPFRASST